MANFDFCHNRINDISPITSPHMSKSNDLLMYHESLMSNDHLMSTQGGLMMPELVPILDTGESLLEALVLASTNPQYDKRLFIALPVQYMKSTNLEHVVYPNCFLF